MIEISILISFCHLTWPTAIWKEGLYAEKILSSRKPVFTPKGRQVMIYSKATILSSYLLRTYIQVSQNVMFQQKSSFNEVLYKQNNECYKSRHFKNYIDGNIKEGGYSKIWESILQSQKWIRQEETYSYLQIIWSNMWKTIKFH